MEDCRAIGFFHGLDVPRMSQVLDLPCGDDLLKALARHHVDWKIPDVDRDTIGERIGFGEAEYRDLGLKMFAAKQRTLIEGGDLLVRTAKDLQMALDVAASVAGCRADASGVLKILAKRESPCSFDNAANEAQAGTALGGFRWLWVDQPVDYGSPSPARARATALGELAAANDLQAMNKLLGPLDVNTIVLESVNLPKSVLRRPEHSALLDVAVGAGALEVTKNLLEFHGAKPTRETLKMALSVGAVELIRVIWERLPPLDHEGRLDLLEVAADFHREEPLEWLLREATELEKEAFAVFALEHHLADALLVGLATGLKPWSWRSRELAAGWPVAAGLELGVPPEDLSVNDGWWLRFDGRLSVIVPSQDREWTPDFNAQDCVEVTLPFGIAGLRASAFRDCPGLRRMTLPSTLTTIGQLALFRCPGLSRLTLPSQVVMIDVNAFGGVAGVSTLMLPSTVTRIGMWAFNSCVGMRSLAFPPALTTLEEFLCAGCSGLTKVTLPAGLRSIEDCAFYECTGLKTVDIPPGVVEIGVGAFRHCAGLVRVEIPPGVVEIRAQVFEGCSSLIEIGLPQGIRRIGNKAFAGCSALVDVVIPGGVTTVGAEAFAGCSRLVRLVVPESVVEIGEFALLGCTSLVRLTFPADVPRMPCIGFRGMLLELELVGATLGPGVFERLVGFVAPSTRVIGAQLVGRSFGRFPIYETT